VILLYHQATGSVFLSHFGNPMDGYKGGEQYAILQSNVGRGSDNPRKRRKNGADGGGSRKTACRTRSEPPARKEKEIAVCAVSRAVQGCDDPLPDRGGNRFVRDRAERGRCKRVSRACADSCDRGSERGDRRGAGKPRGESAGRSAKPFRPAYKGDPRRCGEGH
jgi:hypothetical protein